MSSSGRICRMSSTEAATRKRTEVCILDLVPFFNLPLLLPFVAKVRASEHNDEKEAEFSKSCFFLILDDTIVIGMRIKNDSSSCNVTNDAATAAAVVLHPVSKWKIAVQPGAAENCGGKLRPRWTINALLLSEINLSTSLTRLVFGPPDL